MRTPITAALLAGACFAQPDYLAYVGGYGPSISAFRFHTANGRLTRLAVTAKTPAPSFLVVHPDGHYLYAANEEGKPEDTISAFAIDSKSGKLTLLNTVPSRGSAPCHISIDKTGHFLAVANYHSGSVAVFSILPDGRLGNVAGFDQHHGHSPSNPERQEGPHAHCVVFSPDNRFLLAADLGNDKIYIYRFDASKGAITPNDPATFDVPPGSGPRHLEFHPNGRWLYLLDELQSRVQLLHYDPARGSLEAGETVSTLPDNYTGRNIAAELAVNPAGNLLYASNRGLDNIAMFNIHADLGLLAPMERVSSLGKTPRFFTFDPTGRYLLVANQDSNDLVVFHVHPKTGELQPDGPLVQQLQQPTCIVFVR